MYKANRTGIAFVMKLEGGSLLSAAMTHIILQQQGVRIFILLISEFK